MVAAVIAVVYVAGVAWLLFEAWRAPYEDPTLRRLEEAVPSSRVDATLPGPSRIITVEPIELPVTEPVELPDVEPVETPVEEPVVV